MTKTRVVKAGEREDRLIYEWSNGYRLKMDERGFALYRGDVLIEDREDYFTPDCPSLP